MAKKNDTSASQESIFMRTIQRGIDKGIISLAPDQSKTIYHCSRDYTTSFKNPEEKVRASYFTELIMKNPALTGGVSSYNSSFA